jgi:hypothetical protein
MPWAADRILPTPVLAGQNVGLREENEDLTKKQRCEGGVAPGPSHFSLGCCQLGKSVQHHDGRDAEDVCSSM